MRASSREKLRDLFSILVFASALAACSDYEPGTATDEATDAILAGTPTTARPEVGWIGNCSATLISSRYFITAAHCIGYQARASGPLFEITLNPPPPPPEHPVRSFSIDAIYAFDGDPIDAPDNNAVGRYDIAIGRLEQDVPNEVAMPARIANRDPIAGETVTSVGFGCNQIDPKTGIGTKRFLTHAYPSIGRGCSGDSGGAIFQGNLNGAGDLLGVISGGISGGTNPDAAALPASLKLRIEALVRSLDDGTLEPFNPSADRPGGDLPEMPVFSPTADGCRVRCAMRPECRSFSWTQAGSHCRLKGSVPRAVGQTGVTSGVMFDGLEPGMHRFGDGAQMFVTAGPTECRDECSKRSDCQAFSFVTGTNNCLVYPRVYEGIRDSRVYSGLSLSQSPFWLSGRILSNGIFPGLSADACEARCATNAACVAFSLTPFDWQCTLLETVDTAIPCPDCRGGFKKSLELDTDRLGGDLPNMPIGAVASAADCQLRCVQRNDCRAFTWVEASRNCWLKGFASRASVSAGKVSGIRRGIEVNVHRPGSVISWVDLDDPLPEECQRRCEASSACDSWSLVTKPSGLLGGNLNRCILKDGVPAAETAFGVFSGRKGMFRF